MTDVRSSYPLLIPPDGIGLGQRHDWTSAQSRTFFSWVQASVEPRSELVLQYLGVRFGDPVETLAAVGWRVHELLTEPQFAHPPIPGGQIAVKGHPVPVISWTLTDEGNSLAADVGLLQARFILRDFSPPVRWEFVEKPRNYIYYRVPCLSAPTIPVPADVMFGSIKMAHATLEGIRTSHVWADLYVWFKERVSPGSITG